jgi:hypothetical protein
LGFWVRELNVTGVQEEIRLEEPNGTRRLEETGFIHAGGLSGVFSGDLSLEHTCHRDYIPYHFRIRGQIAGFRIHHFPICDQVAGFLISHFRIRERRESLAHPGKQVTGLEKKQEVFSRKSQISHVARLRTTLALFIHRTS